MGPFIFSHASRPFRRRPHGGSRSGFTLLEILVTVAVIIVIIAVILVNYTSFTSRSGIRVRAAEVSEFVRYAQERSASTEVLDRSAAEPTEGFQAVRLKVRKGLLSDLRLERVPGSFMMFADAGTVAGYADFAAAGAAEVSGARMATLRPSEEYIIDACFINTDGSAPTYTRQSLAFGSADCSQPSTRHILCGSPDPTARTYYENLVRLNNFDILLSVRQPTREVHANIFAVGVSGATERYSYTDGGVRPNGPGELMSDMYEGIRIVFIGPTGLKRSVDVYRTGLVTDDADDGTDGCTTAGTVDSGGRPVVLPTAPTPPPAPTVPPDTPAPPGGGDPTNIDPNPPSPPTGCGGVMRDMEPELYADCETLLAMKGRAGSVFATMNWSRVRPINTWEGITLSVARPRYVSALDIAARNLSGTIPADIGNLSAVRHISMNTNRITGTVPLEMGNLTDLTLLSLETNQLSGSVPTTLGNLTNVRHLILSFNRLTGTVPPELGNLSSVIFLDLSGNRLVGTIPEQLGLLPSVQYLLLRDNKLDGRIPASIGNLTTLLSLDLRGNRLTGSVPASFGNLTRMLSFHLQNNNLSGRIPPGMGNWSDVQTLSLNDNHLSGSIPGNIGNLGDLFELNLHNNDLSGFVPSGLGNLPRGTRIRLDYNRLTGCVPFSPSTHANYSVNPQKGGGRLSDC